MAQKVLIVEDDELLCVSLAEQLRLSGGYRVDYAHTASDGLKKLSLSPIDAVLLDIGLPDMDGREACRKIRSSGYQIPVIMLTAHDGEQDVVGGFDSGATDYITKPFRFRELLVRLRTHLRIHEHHEDTEYRIGRYRFQPNARCLVDHLDSKDKIRLTVKEAAILKYLYRSHDKVVPRAVMLKEVWGYGKDISTHTLETHIYRLRKKIEENADEPVFLRTEYGGYRLNISTTSANDEVGAQDGVGGDEDFASDRLQGLAAKSS